jgi:hypothetical protein
VRQGEKGGQRVSELLSSGKGYEMTTTGIVFRRSLSDDEYDALGIRLAGIANATAWAIGDWLLAGSGRGPDGNAYARAQQLTGRSYESLSQYLRVSAAFTHNERGHGAWTIYREALRLPASERVAAMRLAQQNEWNRNGLIDYINKRLGTDNAIEHHRNQPPTLVKRAGKMGWRGSHEQSAPKRDVCCPQCGHRFDVRRKGLSEAPIEVNA